MARLTVDRWVQSLNRLQWDTPHFRTQAKECCSIRTSFGSTPTAVQWTGRSGPRIGRMRIREPTCREINGRGKSYFLAFDLKWQDAGGRVWSLLSIIAGLLPSNLSILYAHRGKAKRGNPLCYPTSERYRGVDQFSVRYPLLSLSLAYRCRVGGWHWRLGWRKKEAAPSKFRSEARLTFWTFFSGLLRSRP